jgi:ferric-dicitrate binding protein FerR (iron transport regulator)
MKKIGIAPTDSEDEETILANHHPNRNRKRILVFSLAGLAILAIVLFFNPFKKRGEIPIPTPSEVSTLMGSRSSKLVLPDGSIVWLNADSKLSYDKDFGTSSREVSLEGEAFFEVTKMPDLPFIVQTPGMQVRVLGTSFNVKSYLNESTTETSVIHGTVEVIPRHWPDQRFVLRPTDKLVLSNGDKNENKEQQSNALNVLRKTITYSEKDSSVIETSWVENKLAFDYETFAEVAMKMERWYAVKIIFEDEAIAQSRLTGTFTTESIEKALEALQYTYNFKYQINQNIITITK